MLLIISRFAALVVASAALSLGQATLSLSSGASTPGVPVPLQLTLNAPVGGSPAAIQWSLNYPSASISNVAVTEGSAATQAGKTVQCAANAPGLMTCVVYGLSAATIANGVVANISVTATASATIVVTNTLGAAATADALAVNGSSGTLSIAAVPALPTLTGVTCASASLSTNGSTGCNVSLSAAAPSTGLSAGVSSSSTAITVPTSVSIAAGTTSGTFTASAGTIASSETVTLTASLNGSSKTTSILTLPPVDSSAPTVMMTSPAAGQTLSGSVTLSASATDNVHVAGVQFLVDGQPYATEVTVAPYSLQLNTAAFTNGTHTFSARARDDAGNVATSATVSATVSNSSGTFTPIRVNAGGGAYTDASGQVWSADTGYLNGGTFATSWAIANTSTAPVYQTERYNTGTLQYRFAVPNGSYKVTLKFAEIYFNAAGQRVFNVAINSQTLDSNLDVFAAAGGANKAIDRSYTVNVTNGQVAIDLLPVVSNPKISGIEIVTATPATFTPIRVNAGGAAYTDAAGQVWSADNGYLNGGTFATGAAIANTSTAPVYQTERYNTGTLQYRFAVPNGSYKVTLKFAEIYFYSAGQRVFNIAINNQTLDTNFDIFSAAGAANKAIDRSYTVNVTNGQVAIDLVAVVSNPKISGIEIIPATTPNFTPLRVNAGGGAYTDSAGQLWAADTGFESGGAFATTASIANTTTPVLYQTERYTFGTLRYRFAVPNGSYTVRLKFAEIYFFSGGQRVFNIMLNGQVVEFNFEPRAAAGGSNIAVDRAYSVNITNGEILIELGPVVSNPKISAIEITAP